MVDACGIYEDGCCETSRLSTFPLIGLTKGSICSNVERSRLSARMQPEDASGINSTSHFDWVIKVTIGSRRGTCYDSGHSMTMSFSENVTERKRIKPRQRVSVYLYRIEKKLGDIAQRAVELHFRKCEMLFLSGGEVKGVCNLETAGFSSLRKRRTARTDRSCRQLALFCSYRKPARCCPR